MLWAVAALLVVAGISVAWSTLPVRDWAQATTGWVADHGSMARVLFVLIYAVAVMALVPATVPTLAGGLLFGVWAFPLSLLAATLGGTGAFLISRHALSGAAVRAVEGHPRSRAVYVAMGRGGWLMILLWRLSPILPFSVLNYVLGATRAPLLIFVSATAVGIVPGIALYTYAGAVGKAAIAGESVGFMRLGLIALGLVATAAAIGWLGRGALREFRKTGPAS